MNFTQKYAIISPLRPITEGMAFKSTDWPLHVTLADTFAVNLVDDNLMSQLNTVTASSDVTVKGGETTYFGKEKEVEVMLLIPSKELTALHYKIVDILLDHGAIFNDPHYTKEGFIGHVTKQKAESLKMGEVKQLNSIALIDMFPDGDPYLRKVLNIITISRS